METRSWESLLCELLDLVVQHQHKGAAHAPDHVGPSTLEEGFSSLVLENLSPTVDCALVHDVSCGGKWADGDAQRQRISCVKRRNYATREYRGMIFHHHDRRSPPLRPDCIIIRRLTVSKGYEMRPATAVTVWAIIQLTMMCVFLGSGSMPVCGSGGKTLPR